MSSSTVGHENDGYTHSKDTSLSFASRQKRRQITEKSVVSQRLLSELQALIAFACYNSPYIFRSGESLKDVIIMEKMYQYCFGDPNQPDLVPFVDHFLSGVSKFQGVFENKIVENSDLPEFGQQVLSIYPTFHHEGSQGLIYIDKGCIHCSVLEQRP